MARGTRCTIKKLMTEYPNNIFEFASYYFSNYAEENKKLAMMDWNVEQIKGFNYILSDLFEREQQAIKLRFDKHLTFDEIGFKMGIAAELARRLVVNSIKKIINPYKSNYVKYGLEEYTTLLNKDDQDNKQNHLNETNNGMNIATLFNNRRIISALLQNNYYTVNDVIQLIKCEPKKLMTIKNLGKSSVSIIISTMIDKGYLTEEDCKTVVLNNKSRDINVILTKKEIKTGRETNFNVKNSMTDYPNNIFEFAAYYFSLYSEEDNELAMMKWSEDQLKGFNYILSNLNERQQLAMKLRFEQKLTFDEAGLKMGVTRERVRQLVNKSVRRLINPYKSNYVKYGFEKYSKIKDNMMIDKTKKEYDSKIVLQEGKLIKDGVNVQNITINEFFNNIRVKNCLRRAGYTYVVDIVNLIKYEPKKFIMIRNLGKRSIEIVINNLKEKDYLTDEDINNFIIYAHQNELGKYI